MNESTKEKQLRYALIVFVISLTIAAFYFQTKKITGGKAVAPQISAVILHESSGMDNNPFIALYNKQEGNHVLTYYEVERNNQYHFLSHHAVELKKAPTELAQDQSGAGVWVKEKNKWTYYNEQLETATNDRENIRHDAGQSVSFTTKKVGPDLRLTITEGVHVDKELVLSDEDEPLALHSLTTDGSVWLALFKNEVKIIAAR